MIKQMSHPHPRKSSLPNTTAQLYIPQELVSKLEVKAGSLMSDKVCKCVFFNLHNMVFFPFLLAMFNYQETSPGNQHSGVSLKVILWQQVATAESTLPFQ